MLLEGLILSVTSATAGIILSFWGVEMAKSILPSDLARVSSISIDGRVLSVSIAVSILCGLLFASAPAWLAARSNLIGLMKSSGGAIIGGRRRDRSLSGFLVGEIAFVCMLIVATTLVVTSFILITTIDLGFDRQNIMTFSYRRSLENVTEGDRSAVAATLRNDLIERARAVPGVTHVAFSENATAPMSGGSVRYSLEIPGLGETPREDMLETNMVTPDYFDAMGMQLLRGRLFEPTDRAGTTLVMVINDAAARKFFPGRDPLGQVVTFRGPTTIVGVLKNVHFDGPEADVRPAMYIPVDQPYLGSVPTTVSGSLILRTNQDPRLIAPAVQSALRPALASLQPPSTSPEPDAVRFIDDYFARMTATRRFNAGLMAGFGFIAIALGAIGVYGTMAFFVARQVRAIGLRMALGASSSRVMRSVLGAAVGRVALGTAIGLAGAWAVSNALTSYVFGIQPTDVRVYTGVGLLITVIGFSAALMPALRAARLDPLTALREE